MLIHSVVCLLSSVCCKDCFIVYVQTVRRGWSEVRAGGRCGDPKPGFRHDGCNNSSFIMSLGYFSIVRIVNNSHLQTNQLTYCCYYMIR